MEHNTQTLEAYIRDYLLKRNFHASAEVLTKEANVDTGPVAHDLPEGFLGAWWSIFWDIYMAKKRDKNCSKAAATYIEKIEAKETRQQMQGLTQLKTGIKAGSTQKSMHMKPPLYPQAKSRVDGAGLNRSSTDLPPLPPSLTGHVQLQPSLRLPVPKFNLQPQNQFLVDSEMRQVIEETNARVQLNFGSLNKNDIQPTMNNGPLCSPVQLNPLQVGNVELHEKRTTSQPIMDDPRKKQNTGQLKE